MRKFALPFLAGLLILMACQIGATTNSSGRQDTANDNAAAQSVMPNIAGYTSVEATNISQAISSVGGSAALVTGNPEITALVGKIDSMITCYRNVGAISARVYTDANIAQVVAGEIPKVGALAVVNTDRLSRNLLNCAISGNSGFSAQSAGVQPCGGTGQLTRDGENLWFIYAATAPELCSAFVTALK